MGMTADERARFARQTQALGAADHDVQVERAAQWRLHHVRWREATDLDRG